MTERTRAAGHGTVEALPSGRFRFRLRLADGSRRDSETYATEAQAREDLDAMLHLLAEGDLASTGAVTLRAYGETWLNRREASGLHRNIASERSLWRLHIASAPFVEWPLADVTRPAVKAFMESLASKRVTALAPGKRDSEDQAERKAGRRRTSKRLSRQTRVHVVNLLRRCLEDAVDDEVIPSNPARDVRVPKEPTATEGWTFLTADEIATVATSKAIPAEARAIYLAAIYTGLRQGELWGLRWTDVTLDGDRPEVRVARSHDGPTKSGKVRTIPLLEPARAALAAWKPACPKSDDRLVFPSERGCLRQKSDDAGWSTRKVRGVLRIGHRELAGIKRRVRFHDLRHTCASHLIMGSWGTRWSLSEVCAFLRHSNISVTQRYAHLSPDHLHNTAATTARGGGTGGSEGPSSGAGRGPRVVHAGPVVVTATSIAPVKNQGAPAEIRTRDIRLRSPEVNPVGTTLCTPAWTTHGPAVHESIARAVLALTATGAPVPVALLDALAGVVLASEAVRLALEVREGGPLALDRAVRLAEVILGSASAGEPTATPDVDASRDA